MRQPFNSHLSCVKAYGRLAVGECDVETCMFTSPLKHMLHVSLCCTLVLHVLRQILC